MDAVTIWDLKAGRQLRPIGPATDYFGVASIFTWIGALKREGLFLLIRSS